MTHLCLVLAEATANPTSGIRFESPSVRLIIAIAFLVVGLWWLLPGPKRRNRVVGTVVSFVGIGSLWSVVPLIGTISMQTAFWLSAGIAIAASLATITSRKPIYSAIWFAVSLLGVAGLFLLQGAQFLGIATVAVYAGAIVVTFLFVLMLAQPEGHSFFDRISWGRMPRVMVPLFAMLTVGLIAHSVGSVNPAQVELHQSVREYLKDMETNHDSQLKLNSIRVQNAGGDVVAFTISLGGATVELQKALNDRKVELQAKIAQIDAFQFNVIRYRFASTVTAPQHVANLGGQLFSTQLIAIQVAGCLLLISLVGAISIAGHEAENGRRANPEGSAT